MSDWDNLVEPTRGAIEALLRKGDEMADRIEELEKTCAKWAEVSQSNYQRAKAAEAKLAKAVGALGDISNGEPEWPNDPQKELDWCRNRATTILAELKGENDERRTRKDLSRWGC